MRRRQLALLLAIAAFGILTRQADAGNSTCSCAVTLKAHSNPPIYQWTGSLVEGDDYEYTYGAHPCTCGPNAEPVPVGTTSRILNGTLAQATASCASLLAHRTKLVNLASKCLIMPGAPVPFDCDDDLGIEIYNTWVYDSETPSVCNLAEAWEPCEDVCATALENVTWAGTWDDVCYCNIQDTASNSFTTIRAACVADEDSSDFDCQCGPITVSCDEKEADYVNTTIHVVRAHRDAGYVGATFPAEQDYWEEHPDNTAPCVVSWGTDDVRQACGYEAGARYDVKRDKTTYANNYITYTRMEVCNGTIPCTDVPRFDCAMGNWGDHEFTSDCDGYGSKTRDVRYPSLDGGDECPEQLVAYQRKKITGEGDNACEVDDECGYDGEFGPWSPCMTDAHNEADCARDPHVGLGYRYRTRKIKKLDDDTEHTCEASTTELQSCVMNACKVPDDKGWATTTFTAAAGIAFGITSTIAF